MGVPLADDVQRVSGLVGGVVPGFAFNFKPDPKANSKTVKQALSNAGSCSAFCPRGTKCKLCGKVH